METLGRIGRNREIISIRDLRRVLSGYLQVYTYTNETGASRIFARCGSGVSVTVLPYDPDERKVILLAQPRSLVPFVDGIPEARAVLACADRGGTPNPLHVLASSYVSIEAPGGMTNEDERPEDAACRELFEETGIRVAATALRSLAIHHMSVGILVQRVHSYLVPVRIHSIQIPEAGTSSDEGESITVLSATFAEAFQLVEAGSIHAPCTADLLRALEIQILKGKT